jgi:F0F1-type ATP synthase gamma subunit
MLDARRPSRENVRVKRATKNKKKSQKKTKVPHPFIPIVDAVVEGVFARLSEAAANAKLPKGKRGSARAREAAAPESDRGLAGAIADLLLASLTREASKPKRAPRTARRGRRVLPRPRNGN